MNVLSVALDTLRARQLGRHGHRYPTGPNLNAFGQSGVRFENFHAPGTPPAPWIT